VVVRFVQSRIRICSPDLLAIPGLRDGLIKCNVVEIKNNIVHLSSL
jgi:hypothetical protein